VNDSGFLDRFQPSESPDPIGFSLVQFLRGLSTYRAAGHLPLIIGVDLIAFGASAGQEHCKSLDHPPVNSPDPACSASMMLSGKSGSRQLQGLADGQCLHFLLMKLDRVLRE